MPRPTWKNVYQWHCLFIWICSRLWGPNCKYFDCTQYSFCVVGLHSTKCCAWLIFRFYNTLGSAMFLTVSWMYMLQPKTGIDLKLYSSMSLCVMGTAVGCDNQCQITVGNVCNTANDCKLAVNICSVLHRAINI